MILASSGYEIPDVIPIHKAEQIRGLASPAREHSRTESSHGGLTLSRLAGSDEGIRFGRVKDQ